MEKGLVSIITPMYNVAAFVGECIESVIAQTYTNWEMIIVDDCSPDGGAGIRVVEKYAREDSRIKLICNKVNSGSSGARNTALKAARGQYLSFLDSDDIWVPQFLEHQLAFMKEKNAICAFSSYYRIDENTKEEILSPYIVPSTATYKSLLMYDPIFPSTAIYDRSGLKKEYLFDTSHGSMRDDYVFWLDLMKEIPVAYGNKEKLVYYRMRKVSATSNKLKVIIPQWNVIRKVEKRPFLECCYNIVCWAFIAWNKYRK